MKKFLVLSEYYDQFDKYQPSCVSFLEPRQSNLSNAGACLKPYQTSNMNIFAKKNQGLKDFKIFVKHSILDV